MARDERDPQTFAIIGAAMEVHNQLGHGFLEAVYKDALVLECRAREIPFGREISLEVMYKGQPLATRYRADFICFNEIILEIKAQSALTGADEAQLINYLKATGFHRGLLINFGAPSLQYRRLVFGYQTPK
ncbi:MAG: GxxExxY protein [Anaerolineales bacterium]